MSCPSQVIHVPKPFLTLTFIHRWVLLAALPLFCLANTAMATPDDEDSEIEQLRAQLAVLTARLDALESTPTIPAQSYAVPETTATASSATSWAERIKLKGDFRYRHEAFDVEDRNERHRQRIRARTELQAKINDRVQVGFGLATGGDDPISTNQTLDDGASSKGVVVDLAYVSWETPVDGLGIKAGKFKNVFHRAGGNGLVWDGDLRPEGLGVQFNRGAFFANAATLWVDESSSGEDSLLVGGQFGLNTSFDTASLRSGLGYYHYTDAKGRSAFFDGAAQGNRTNPDGTYVSDFHLMEGFAEYQFETAHSKITLFADFVQNLAADDYDTAWALGVKLKRAQLSLGWTYQDVEADSVLGTFSDSDFIGGGTDGEGHILQAGYALSKKIALKGTLFLNNRNVDFGQEEDFKRLMLDISYKY
jgi:hypothetical protein